MLRSYPIGLLWIALATSSCAASRREPTAANRRVKDSPAETVAAHRAAAPRNLELEKEDERWPFEAARERKRAREREDAAKPRPGAGVGTTDVVEPNKHR
jgi:hypothetical protein